MKRLAALLLAAAALAGCGAQQRGHGTATLWVTRDEGRQVLLTTTVAAGQSAIRALERTAHVKTSYGGRYVQAVNGIEGSLAGGRDWFYFVNGVAPDVGAGEYRLRAGDVEWWDYRSWKGRPEVPAVVGAFPEPFLHGYGGRVRPAVAIGPGAAAIAGLLHARVAASAPRGANVFRVVSGAPHFRASMRPGGGVEFEFAGDVRALARDPSRYRYRYSVG